MMFNISLIIMSGRFLLAVSGYSYNMVLNSAQCIEILDDIMAIFSTQQQNIKLIA